MRANRLFSTSLFNGMLFLLLTLLFNPVVQAKPKDAPPVTPPKDLDAIQQSIKQFIKEFTAENKDFDQASLEKLLGDAKYHSSIIDAISRPAEKKEWKDYRKIFLTKRRIKDGVKFMRKYKDTLARAEKTYQVPKEIITAIIGVETFYGTRKGSYSVLDSLYTLGFHYPPRAKFFRKELGEFLLLSQTEKLDVKNLKGSYAGAIGIPQFISSSYRRYAVDFDGDKQRNLFDSYSDAIGSVASYFQAHKWKAGEPIISRAHVCGDKYRQLVSSKLSTPKHTLKKWQSVDVYAKDAIPVEQKAFLLDLQGENGKEHWLAYHNFYVITRYNHSSLYALAVYQLSEAIKNAQ